MAEQPVKLPEYAPDQFVDRRKEVNIVLDKASALAQARSVDRRTTVFIGERGTGKSWLLAHLQTELRSRTDVIVFSLSLTKYTDRDPVMAAVDILRELSAATGGRRERLGLMLADISRNVMQSVRQLLNKKVLILLVDHVYESDWRLLAALEEYLLGPLAIEPRVLIVMAGRGRAYPWKTPELRLKAQFVKLKPFQNELFTKEQLAHQQKMAVPRAQEIHALSGGNPLANFLLAAHDDPAQGMDRVAEGMLETVPADSRRLVRDYLEALCVLRAFDEERIPTMLAAYYNDPKYKHWSYAEARRVREELIRWAFAHYDPKQGGYVLDEMTQKLVEGYLKKAQRHQWERLQQAASKLYDLWARDYKPTQERWQEESEYHTGQLQAVHSTQLSVAA